MDRELFIRTIRAFQRRTPFQPFTVSLVNGERIEVDYPEALAVRGGGAIFFAPENVPVIFDYTGVAQIVGDLATTQPVQEQ